MSANAYDEWKSDEWVNGYGCKQKSTHNRKPHQRG